MIRRPRNSFSLLALHARANTSPRVLSCFVRTAHAPYERRMPRTNGSRVHVHFFLLALYARNLFSLRFVMPRTNGSRVHVHLSLLALHARDYLSPRF